MPIFTIIISSVFHYCSISDGEDKRPENPKFKCARDAKISIKQIGKIFLRVYELHIK